MRKGWLGRCFPWNLRNRCYYSRSARHHLRCTGRSCLVGMMAVCKCGKLNTACIPLPLALFYGQKACLQCACFLDKGFASCVLPLPGWVFQSIMAQLDKRNHLTFAWCCRSDMTQVQLAHSCMKSFLQIEEEDKVDAWHAALNILLKVSKGVLGKWDFLSHTVWRHCIPDYGGIYRNGWTQLVGGSLRISMQLKHPPKFSRSKQLAGQMDFC